MSDVYIVYTTTSGEEEAASIARTVVDERLAACGNILPKIRSIYRWQGVVEDEAESAVLFKTQADRVDALIQRIKTLHSYEVPDIVAYPVERGHAPYLDWVRANS